jgi:hypothetical protein
MKFPIILLFGILLAFIEGNLDEVGKKARREKRYRI